MGIRFIRAIEVGFRACWSTESILFRFYHPQVDSMEAFLYPPPEDAPLKDEKISLLRMNKIRKAPTGLECPIVLSDAFITVDDDKILNDAAPVLTSSEMKNIMKTITNFFIPELNNHDVQKLWFQQDGATCHTARATIDLLKDTFGDRLISRFGPVNWPPRPCDLTPLDYFLWGYVKSLVYADKPQTLDHLEDNIRRVIADIRPQMLEKVIENWTSRLDYIRASRGSPMPEIIFKIAFASTLSSRRVASPLVKLVEGEERREAPERPQGVLPQNWGGTEPKRTVTCRVLKATDNDRRTT
ncbi:DUF4817 domain-containing protein [Trichonephila clavipes]|nr:DUF4817 domain-containing protein [Trichonephila clavipes]